MIEETLLTDEQLAEIVGLQDDLESITTATEIQVCAGTWIRVGDRWNFDKDPEWEE